MRRMKLAIALITITITSLSFATLIEKDLYGLSSNTTLYAYDVLTGISTSLGSNPFYHTSGLAFGSDGLLYDKAHL